MKNMKLVEDFYDILSRREEEGATVFEVALRPDSIRINGDPAEAALVAVAPNAICPDGEYQAVV